MSHEFFHDFSGQNLRGRNFRGQDLTGANFRNADIRGANFTDSTLRSANFSRSQSGLQHHHFLLIALALLIFACISGFFAVFAGWHESMLLDAEIFNRVFDEFRAEILKNPEQFKVDGDIPQIPSVPFTPFNSFLGAALPIMLFTFFLLLFYFGWITAIAFSLLAALLLGFAQVEIFRILDSQVQSELGKFTIFIFNGSLVSVFLLATTIACTLVLSGGIASRFTMCILSAFIFFWILFIVKSFTAILLAIQVSLLNCIVFILLVAGLFVFGGYIGWQSFLGNRKFSLIRKFAIFVGSLGGTNFQNANLAHANFSEARLKSANFRTANLTRVYWRNAQGFNLGKFETTYLKNEPLRNLVLTGRGENKNFDGLDLSSLNLRGANLENASLIDVNFYDTDLRETNLSRTRLVRTQFEKADLSGSCLTGSCIQDWVITKSSKFDRIDCEYVYLKWINGDKRDQMPPRGKFSSNGFFLFINYILDTVTLYHEKDINPRLALTVLKRLSQDYEEPLDIVAIGKQDERVFIKIKLSKNVEEEKFKEDYFSEYESDLRLFSTNLKPLPSVDELTENRITEIASRQSNDNTSINITHIEYLNATKDLFVEGEVAVEKIEIGGDSFSGKNIGIAKVTGGEVTNNKIIEVVNENNQGYVASGEKINMVNQKSEGSNINISDITGSKIGGIVGGDNTGVVGQVSGIVTNTINELQASDRPQAAELATLLKQLQVAIETEPDLELDDKDDALAEVNTLAKAGQNPQDGTLKKLANRSLKIIKGTIAALPDTAKLVEACSKLLPAIASLLGL